MLAPFGRYSLCLLRGLKKKTKKPGLGRSIHRIRAIVYPLLPEKLGGLKQTTEERSVCPWKERPGLRSWQRIGESYYMSYYMSYSMSPAERDKSWQAAPGAVPGSGLVTTEKPPEGAEKARKTRLWEWVCQAALCLQDLEGEAWQLSQTEFCRIFCDSVCK